MRLAVSSGPLPDDIDAVDARLAAKVRELGFTGVGVHFGAVAGSDPAELDTARCRRAREILAAHGVAIVQSWAFGANLAAPDARGQVGRLQESVRVAADLGAPTVICGPGSRNPRGLYWPHPDNHAPETLERLVARLREAAKAAEHHGIAIALEPHVATALDTPKRAREVVDAVGSPGVRVNLDPVNFVGDLRTLFDAEPLLDRVFAALAGVATSGHVKDVYAEERLVVHLSETLIGDGSFPIASYLRRFEQALPDAYLIVEHLPEELVAQAKAALDELCAEERITLR